MYLFEIEYIINVYYSKNSTWFKNKLKQEKFIGNTSDCLFVLNKKTNLILYAPFYVYDDCNKPLHISPISLAIYEFIFLINSKIEKPKLTNILYTSEFKLLKKIYKNNNNILNKFKKILNFREEFNLFKFITIYNDNKYTIINQLLSSNNLLTSSSNNLLTSKSWWDDVWDDVIDIGCDLVLGDLSSICDIPIPGQGSAKEIIKRDIKSGKIFIDIGNGAKIWWDGVTDFIDTAEEKTTDGIMTFLNLFVDGVEGDILFTMNLCGVSIKYQSAIIKFFDDEVKPLIKKVVRWFVDFVFDTIIFIAVVAFITEVAVAILPEAVVTAVGAGVAWAGDVLFSIFDRTIGAVFKWIARSARRMIIGEDVATNSIRELTDVSQIEARLKLLEENILKDKEELEELKEIEQARLEELETEKANVLKLTEEKQAELNKLENDSSELENIISENKTKLEELETTQTNVSRLKEEKQALLEEQEANETILRNIEEQKQKLADELQESTDKLNELKAQTGNQLDFYDGQIQELNGALDVTVRRIEQFSELREKGISVVQRYNTRTTQLSELTEQQEEISAITQKIKYPTGEDGLPLDDIPDDVRIELEEQLTKSKSAVEKLKKKIFDDTNRLSNKELLEEFNVYIKKVEEDKTVLNLFTDGDLSELPEALIDELDQVSSEF